METLTKRVFLFSIDGHLFGRRLRFFFVVGPLPVFFPVGPSDLVRFTVPLGDWLEKKKATAIIIKQKFGFPMSTT